jgi:hypothetical protein
MNEDARTYRAMPRARIAAGDVAPGHIEAIRHHCPAAQMETAEADIPFEASDVDRSRLRAVVNCVPEHDLEEVRFVK